MTIQEFREHPEYALCMRKITGYKTGFKFTLNWSEIPRAKANALKIVIRDAMEQGLIENVADGWSLEGQLVSETFRRC